MLEWMTEVQHIKCSVVEFLELLDFPRFESKGCETRVHLIDEIMDEQFHLLMEPKKVAHYLLYGVPLPEYLRSTINASTIFCAIPFDLSRVPMTRDQSTECSEILSMPFQVDMFLTSKTYSSASLLIPLKNPELAKPSHLGYRKLSISHEERILCRGTSKKFYPPCS